MKLDFLFFIVTGKPKQMEDNMVQKLQEDMDMENN